MLGDVLAVIAQGDFDRFRSFGIGGFPDTWGGWQSMARGARSEWPNAAMVEIFPTEFDEWFRTTGRPTANVEDLWRFAQEKAGSSKPKFAQDNYDPQA